VSTAVIGATGRIGGEIVRSIIARSEAVITSMESMGINQRAHYFIDEFAFSTAVPYSTIRRAIFSASLLAAAGGRLAHLDRSRRQRPHCSDRPSRRGQGGAAGCSPTRRYGARTTT
jgi:hypothetical protein